MTFIPFLSVVVPVHSNKLMPFINKKNKIKKVNAIIDEDN